MTDDSNRVVLKPLEGHDNYQSDYINASYVDVRIICRREERKERRREGGREGGRGGGRKGG